MVNTQQLYKYLVPLSFGDPAVRYIWTVFWRQQQEEGVLHARDFLVSFSNTDMDQGLERNIQQDGTEESVKEGFWKVSRKVKGIFDKNKTPTEKTSVPKSVTSSALVQYLQTLADENQLKSWQLILAIESCPSTEAKRRCAAHAQNKSTAIQYFRSTVGEATSWDPANRCLIAMPTKGNKCKFIWCIAYGGLLRGVAKAYNEKLSELIKLEEPDRPVGSEPPQITPKECAQVCGCPLI